MISLLRLLPKLSLVGILKFLFHFVAFLIIGTYVVHFLLSENNQIIYRQSEQYEEHHTIQSDDTFLHHQQEMQDEACIRKNELVYIKTHKTGSCTVVNMLYRVALKYNIPVLLFKTMPYPSYGIDKFYIHKLNFLFDDINKPAPKTFQMAAEHMRYEKKELDKVIAREPLYTTTVRRPLDHLKSVFNYFGMAEKLGMPSDLMDPAIEYIRNKDKYHFVGKRKGYHISNGISNMLGLSDSDANDPVIVDRFLQTIPEEIGLFMVTEYMAESFLLLRRKMCWDMTDVLYTSINVRKYKGKKVSDDAEIIAKHKEWNGVDYMLYDRANHTFWSLVNSLGSDFQEELKLYKSYNARIGEYCSRIIEQLKGHPSNIYDVYDTEKPMILPASKWGGSVTIDAVWCASAQIDIMPFYNILRVKQYPQICDYLDDDPKLLPHMFRVDVKHAKIKMVPNFCVNYTGPHLIPLEVLATRGIYSWN